MRPALLATAILGIALPALAQGNAPAPVRDPGPPQPVTPWLPETTVVVGPGTANSGPGANTTIARSGTGAATITTDSAAGGNAEQPSRAVPQVGGGGGSGGGGQ